MDIKTKKKIVIGVITFKRPQGLKDLLESLARQNLTNENSRRYEWSAVVVDNDMIGKNKDVVDDISKRFNISLSFIEEPKRGIPSARNASVNAAKGCDAFIFVDDDEIAPDGWLDAMLTMWHQTEADVITGPVYPILPKKTSHWVKKSRIFIKDYSYGVGQVLTKAFTNNTLVSREVLNDLGATFDSRFQYTGSSDLHYFMRVKKKGYKILWCPAAAIYETIPESRLKFSWIIKRGFRVGNGETRAHMYIYPGHRTIFKVLYRSSGRFVIGFIQALLFPLFGWRGFIVGCKRMSSGIGAFCGLFGLEYQEYNEIHGK